MGVEKVFCDAPYDFIYEKGFVHARAGWSAAEVRVTRRCGCQSHAFGYLLWQWERVMECWDQL